MVRLTALYPNTPGAKFDFDYYASVHMALVKDRLTAFGLNNTEIIKGISTLSDERAPYVCIGTLDFDDADGLKRGMGQHGEELVADIANFTDIEPTIQINDVLS